jgi:hypothetical protein
MYNKRIAVVVVLTFAAIASIAIWRYDSNKLTPDNWVKIQPGMAASDVRIILGQPDNIIEGSRRHSSPEYPGFDEWAYGRDWHGRWVAAGVFIRNDIVVGKACSSCFTRD